MQKIGKYHTLRICGAFTLVEAMMAVVIVGLGVTGLMYIVASGTTVNAFGNQLSSATYLAEELRTMTDIEEFESLTDYDGLSFAGVDSDGNAIAGMQGYVQSLTVTAVDPTTLASDPTSDVILIAANVSYQGKEMVNMTWLRIQ